MLNTSFKILPCWHPRVRGITIRGMAVLYMFRVQRLHRPWSWGSHTAGVYMSRMQHGVTKVKTMDYIKLDPGSHIWLFILSIYFLTLYILFKLISRISRSMFENCAIFIPRGKFPSIYSSLQICIIRKRNP